MNVRCNGCGYIGAANEFPTGRDMFQKSYIAGCPKCDNRQSPGGASMRMFGGERSFSFVRPELPDGAEPIVQVFHNAAEAS